MTPVNSSTLRIALVILGGSLLSACVTSRVEHIKEATTGIAEGEGIVGGHFANPQFAVSEPVRIEGDLHIFGRRAILP